MTPIIITISIICQLDTWARPRDGALFLPSGRPAGTQINHPPRRTAAGLAPANWRPLIGRRRRFKGGAPFIGAQWPGHLHSRC